MQAKFMLRGIEKRFTVQLVERDGFKQAPPLVTEYFDIETGSMVQLRLQAVADRFAYYQIV